MDSMQLYLVSLGCPKNLVDSEVMLGSLMENGLSITQDPEKADVIIVNTCSFIESAVNESIDMILELSEYKKTGRCRRLIVAGCLPQRFKEDLAQTLPEVDIFLGTTAAESIVHAAKDVFDAPTCILSDPNLTPVSGKATHHVRSNPHHAYIKIAEGCDRRCTFCVIPKLRGNQKSRPISDILFEAESLIAAGVKELILIAQDTTSYGRDLVQPATLKQLLERMSDLSGDFRIRFLYAYPGRIDKSLMDTIANRNHICSYFDIPVQHVSREVLRRMGRRYKAQNLYHLIKEMRSRVPDVALRTTLMVGFPGETADDFNQLYRFVQDIQFDHMGIFMYSDEPDVASHGLSKKISKAVSQSRMDRLMLRQAKISLNKNKNRLGEVHRVLVEEKAGPGRYIGRTAFQAPEIDGVTFIKANALDPGQFVEVRISEGLEYDLKGEIV